MNHPLTFILRLKNNCNSCFSLDRSILRLKMPFPHWTCPFRTPLSTFPFLPSAEESRIRNIECDRVIQTTFRIPPFAFGTWKLETYRSTEFFNHGSTFCLWKSAVGSWKSKNLTFNLSLLCTSDFHFLTSNSTNRKLLFLRIFLYFLEKELIPK